jgi:lipopolysaccharide transport system permease protein
MKLLSSRLNPSLGLVLLFSRQELVDRHRENALGALWLLVQPLAFIVLFSTVFSHFMRARLGSDADPNAYTVYLIGGVLTWNLFANAITRLASVYSGKAYLIRKVELDLWLMPLHVLVTEGVVYVISMAFFTVFLLWIGHMPTLSWLALPVVMLVLATVTYAIGITLGTLDVFLPDIKNALGILLQFGFWLTPVVYLPEILPPWAQNVLVFNPLYVVVDAVHQIIVFDRMPAWPPLAALLAGAVLLLLLSHWLLRRLESEIRDLL